MRKLKSSTARILALLGVVLFLTAAGFVVWTETHGIRTDPSPVCGPSSYAEQASRPDTCQ